MAEKERATIVNSVRLPHSTLATIVHYYESNGVSIGSVSEVLRSALEDFAHALVQQKLSREFLLSEALARVSHLRNQPSRRGELRKQLVSQVSLEMLNNETPMPDDQEQVREVMRQLAMNETTVQNARKGE